MQIKQFIRVNRICLCTTTSTFTYKITWNQQIFLLTSDLMVFIKLAMMAGLRNYYVMDQL